LPRDVKTRWNSTYNLLRAAYEYRKAIDMLTSNREMDLRKQELSSDEFEVTKELRDVMRVSLSQPRHTLIYGRTGHYRASLVDQGLSLKFSSLSGLL